MVNTKNLGQRMRRRIARSKFGARSGQALVEYALILILVAVAAGVTLAATGPAMANIFSNVIFNIIGQDRANLEFCPNPEDPDTQIPCPLIQGQAAAFWATVAFIRNNPQLETPYPTPIDLPERSEEPGPSVNTNTYTHTYTPSNTFTPTPTNTPTNTNTFTPGPPSTPDDFVFDVPHVDLSDKPEWWRLDNTFGIGGGQWNAIYYTGDNYDGTPYSHLEYLAGNGFIDNTWFSSGPGNTPTSVSGFPIGDTDFSATYTKSLYIPYANDPVRITYTISDGDDSVAILLNGSAIGGPFLTSGTFDYTFPVGNHTLEIRYRDPSGDARLTVFMERLSTNPEDSPSNSCSWLNIGSNPNSNSPTSVWDEDGNTTPTNWPSGQTCVLELRGSVDINGVPSPMLSWWDVWDFSANSGVTAELQAASYVVDGYGYFDRAGASWVTIASHGGSTANYNWTRNQIDLSSLGLGNQITFRFRLTSTMPGDVRWNIDDIEVLSDPTAPAFTVGDEWDMNDRTQMADFIFNGDSNYLRSVTGGDIEGWRWDVTGTNARSGTGWDGSPGGSFPQSVGSGAGPEQQRISYLEFRRPIDLSAAPATDSDGDTGTPILTFWQAYDIATGNSLSVQWTRDSITDGVEDTWTNVPNEGLLLNSTGGTPPPTELNDAGATRTNLTMHIVEVHLAQIPNFDTQSFRLRFALTSSPGATAADWYLDELRLEREDLQTYEPYPMLDNAENASAASKRWQVLGPSDAWQISSTMGGYRGSGNAFADSNGNYTVGQTTAIEMERMLDLLNDTPANDPPGGEAPSRVAAVLPQLSFMWLGDMENVDLAVDVWSAHTNQWRQIWTYDVIGRRQQNAWERIEIDLKQALVDSLRAATGDASWQWGGVTATSITGNSITEDDDIRVRIRLITSGGTARDGVYVDNIRIAEGEPYTHKLWGATPYGDPGLGAGNDTLVDDIESRLPNLGTLNDSWSERWYAGGSTDPTNAVTARNGAYSMSESPIGNYTANSRIYIELVPVVDLRGTDPVNVPALDFFTRYNIDSGDSIRVEIAVEDAANTSQGYNKLAGWGNWTSVVASQPSTPTRIDTWFLSRVDLSSYIGNRIRIRFVVDTDGSAELDGQYIDGVKISTGLPTLTSGPVNIFEDTFSYPPNWIFDGNWGVTQQYVSANNTDSWYLGVPWDGFFANCETFSVTCNGSNLTAIYNMLTAQQDTGLALDDMSALVTGLMPDTPSFDVVEWLDAGRPQPQAGYGSGYTPGSEWDNSWAGRWVRPVTLTAGQTYRVYAIADDGVLLEIDDNTDTDIPDSTYGANPAGAIINDWSDHGARLIYSTFTVTGSSDITRNFILSFYENSGNARLSLSIVSSGAYSATDSPNTPGGTGGTGDNTVGYTRIDSANYGYSSIMLNGVIDLTGTTSPEFIYERYYNITNSSFRLEFSSDGGFTWADGDTVLTGGSVLPPSNWQTRTVTIPVAYRTAQFTFRFRLDTRGAGSGSTGDSAWIGSVVIRD